MTRQLAAAEPPTCRCDGTGTYTVSIPLADAVVSIERQCTVHGQPIGPVRALALDDETGRIGEVMRKPAGDGYGRKYALRPVGGGLEWEAERAHVQVVDDPGRS